ncbi:MAG: single-stranded-DNA-specific exonuclease RecJ [Fibrobacterota bacterium]
MDEIIIEKPVKASPETIGQLRKAVELPEALLEVLVKRGVETPEGARKFIRPDTADMHDPFLLTSMDKAVERIIKSLQKKEIITVFGDYDVDGITATALLMKGLDGLGADVNYFLPDRLSEGYGLSEECIDNIAKRGTKLIITVDCGISSAAEVEYAAKIGIDIIITDHHEKNGPLPGASAVINPKTDENGYPFKELAGVGVALKLFQALMSGIGDMEFDFSELLALAAIGSAADIVPLKDENRIIVRKGFEVIKNKSFTGLEALLKKLHVPLKEISTSTVIFKIAPFINSAGRMETPDCCVELLTTGNSEMAGKISGTLLTLNNKRKETDHAITKEAVSYVDNNIDLKETSVIVLASKEWHSGVIGIVASRLAEKYNRPTIIISVNEEGTGTGSGRSIENFHLYDAVSCCSDLLVKYGGHKYASGLTILSENITEFRKRINESASSYIASGGFNKTVKPDSELTLSYVNDDFFRKISLLEPFGPDNTNPVFLFKSLRLTAEPEIIGQRHLKFEVSDGKNYIFCMAFNKIHLREKILQKSSGMDIAATILRNGWKGKYTYQLKVKGIS